MSSRWSPDGVWRSMLPHPTRAQLRLLSALADVGWMIADANGRITLQPTDTALSPVMVAGCVLNGWVTEPLPALPLFNQPAQNGVITEAGRAALRNATDQRACSRARWRLETRPYRGRSTEWWKE